MDRLASRSIAQAQQGEGGVTAIAAIHAPRLRSLKWGTNEIAPVVETGAAKSERTTTMSSVANMNLSQSDGAENPRAENFMRLSPGRAPSRPREMFFISVRQERSVSHFFYVKQFLVGIDQRGIADRS